MEAVLDSASAMLAAARPAPLPLLLASLQLVDAATQPDGAGGMLHAAGGLMEVELTSPDPDPSPTPNPNPNPTPHPQPCP